MKKILKPLLIGATILIISFTVNLATDVIAKTLLLRSVASAEETKYIEQKIEVVEEKTDVSRGEERKFKTVKAVVTAYAPYDNKSGICADSDPNHTATMTTPRMGVLAADPKRLPYGTKLYIPGYGEGVVEDTGGALRSDKENIRIDVFMNTYEEARAWGKQELEVIVYE